MSWGEVWTETGTDVGWIHAELASNQVDGSGGSGCVGRVWHFSVSRFVFVFYYILVIDSDRFVISLYR